MASASQTAEPLVVLVVEDNPLIRDLFRHAVRKLAGEAESIRPIQLLEIGDGATAWQHLEAKPVELLVVDLYLPVLGGIELIERVRDKPEVATTKILAMSASYTDAKARSLGAGADQFIQKPLQLVDLLECLRSLLRSNQ